MFQGENYKYRKPVKRPHAPAPDSPARMLSDLKWNYRRLSPGGRSTLLVTIRNRGACFSPVGFARGLSGVGSLWVTAGSMFKSRNARTHMCD